MVEIWDADSSGDTLLDTTFTDNSGYYISDNISNSDEEGGGQDIYVKVYSTDNRSVRVTDFSAPGKLYNSVTQVQTDVSDGDVDMGSYSLDSAVNRMAWYIYDLIANEAFDYLADNVGWQNVYKLQVKWSPTNTSVGTGYQPGGAINLLAGDRWDSDVFLHEYGHFVMYKIYGNYLPPAPGCSAHYWGGHFSLGCAWVEGWANFLQAAIQNDPNYVDTEDQTLHINFEPPIPSASHAEDEGAVAASLWDIFDPASTSESWDTIGNGINGSSNNGIWSIVNGVGPSDVLEFYSDWINSSNGYNSEITSIFQHHKIDPATGSLKVSVSPSAAVSAGAQWRVDGGSWRNSGYTQAGLSVGSHTVEFKALTGWSKPGNKTVTINYNQTANPSGTYTRQTGSLKVSMSPSAAVSAGAQWRVDGGSWRNSGYTQSGLSVGSHTVEFKALTGWSKPGNKTVTINYNQTANPSGTYTRQTGSLKVSVSPSAAVSAGAQWRVDGGSWRNSGYTQSGLSVGSHTVEFKALTGWSKPGNKTVTINYNQTANPSGTYTRQTGSLKVSVSPSAAVSAGAQWRVDGGSWRNSGYTQAGLSVGSHTVEFKAVTGWSKPGNKTVTINYNQTTNPSGTYTRQTGSLKVSVSPSAAVSAGAQWRVDGGSWRNSGYTQAGLSVGSHTLEFKAVSGWSRPSNKTVTINYNQTTNASGTYTQQTGSLKVSVSPSAAVSAGAQWRVDGGSWRNSGYTQAGLSVGSHTLEFKAVSGWSRPSNKTVTINYNQTTNASGTYTQQTGSLKVSVSPSAAVSAGAQWRVDGGSWRNSGYTQAGLSVGSHTLEFKAVSGWAKSGDKTVTINYNQTTNASGTYTQQTGSLKVSVSPSAAVSAGAQWRVDGGSWRNSGYTQAGLSVGSHTLEFKAVSGWAKSGDKTVTINYNQTTNASGTYTQQTGSLKVSVSPSAAVSAGAQWRVDGGSWRNSGYTQAGLSIGSHTLEFKAVSGWAKSGDKTVTINYNQTTNASGTYTQETTEPSISITIPTSNPTYSTSNSSLNIGGTAADNQAVTSVSWENSRGGSGTCSGTTTWSNSGIALSSGENIISVTAKDAVGNTATATLTVTYTPPDTAPEIVEEDSYPHDAQGMDDGTLRVPIDTSIVTRIKSDGGIDENSVAMSIENQSANMLIEKQSVNIRLQEVNEGDDTDFWIIHSPNTPFAFEQAVNFTVDAKNLNDVEMVTYYSSFKIESEEEHAVALADTPPSTESADDPVIGQNTIAADPGTAIEGAKIIYGNLEPVTPRFGPLEEIPNLDIIEGVGVPLNLQPANVFVKPVTVFIPCPGETDLGILEIYVFNPAIGWQASWETDGCIVPGSRVNHGPDDPDPTEPPTIEVQLNHFSGVQAGRPAELILPSAGAGDEELAGKGGTGGGGGGGCFITAASGGSQKLKVAPLAFIQLLTVGFAGFVGIRRKLKK